MRKFIQVALFFFLIFIIFFFNKKYISLNDNDTIKQIIPDNQEIVENDTNLVKNLKYEVHFDKKKSYIITSEFSELINSINGEILKMKSVIATIINEKKIPIVIYADEAEYNNMDLITKFKDNVSVSYKDNKIFSDKLELNIKNNQARIYENARIIGDEGSILTDNIIINLKSEKIDIYMNNKEDNVNIIKN